MLPYGFLRHGSDERGFGSRSLPPRRPRSRDGRGNTSEIRSGPAGHEERREWLDALEDVKERVKTIETTQRSHAQSIAGNSSLIEKLHAKIGATDVDIVNYKEYISQTLFSGPTSVQKSFEMLDARVYEFSRLVSEVLQVRISATDAKLDSIQATLDELGIRLRSQEDRIDSQSHEKPAPQTFDIQAQALATPGVGGSNVAEEVYVGRPVTPQDLRQNQVATQECQTSPFIPGRVVEQQAIAKDPMQENDGWRKYLESQRAQVPNNVPVPNVTTQHAEDRQSPFQGSPMTPPVAVREEQSPAPGPPPKVPQSFQSQPTHHQGYAPQYGPVHYGQPCPASAAGFPAPGQGANVPMYPQGGQPHQFQAATFEICKKKNEALKKFTGNVNEYTMWRERMIDHMCRSNRGWRRLLEELQVYTEPITKTWLIGQFEGGYSGWQLSEMLEAFIVEWISDSMCRRRTQLSGGEKGNGFEMWRLLYSEFQGGSAAVQLGGNRRLQEWPRCNRLEALSAHLDDWVECLQTHCAELLHAPGVLRSMILGVIPTEFEDELLTKPHVKTWQEIVEWCKIKTVYKRQKVLAENARRPNGGRINAFMYGLENSEEEVDAETALGAKSTDPPAGTDSSAPPAWFQDFVHKLGTQKNPRKPKKEDKGNVEEPKKKSSRIVFKGCWHCGKEGHSRSACEEFKKLMANHNRGISDKSKWTLPVGYKGKYEIAKAKAKKARVNQLDGQETDQDANTEADDWEDSDADLTGPNMGQVRALWRNGCCEDKCGCESIKRLALSDDDDIVLCNSWDHLDADSEPEEETTVDSESESVHEAFQSWAHKLSMEFKPSPTPSEPVQVESVDQLEQLLKTKSRVAKVAASPGKRKMKKFRNALPNSPIEDDEMVVLVDSGATINAAHIPTHFTDCRSSIVASHDSQVGAAATTAGGHQLVNEGRCKVDTQLDGMAFPIVFQNMKVDVPILSVRKYVKGGWNFSFGEDGGTMVNRTTGKTFNFIEAEGAYWIKVKVQRHLGNKGGRMRSPVFSRPGVN